MSISIKKKKALYDFHDGICEQCKKKFPLSEIEIHKINPELGYLDHRNLKVLCEECHEIFTSAQNIASGIQGR